MYRNEWFHGRLAVKQLPSECIADCSGAGDVTESVDYWVDRLRFDGPSWYFRQYLREQGAWSSADLCDHNANRKRVLWLWACYARQQPDLSPAYLYLGV